MIWKTWISSVLSISKVFDTFENILLFIMQGLFITVLCREAHWISDMYPEIPHHKISGYLANLTAQHCLTVSHSTWPFTWLSTTYYHTWDLVYLLGFYHDHDIAPHLKTTFPNFTRIAQVHMIKSLAIWCAYNF